MGSYNGAKVCNMIGLFMLNQLKKINIFNNEELEFTEMMAWVIQSPRTTENKAKAFHRFPRHQIKLYQQNIQPI